MGRFDSWQPVIPSMAKGLDYLGDALSSRRDYELKKKAQEQTARFENEQNAAIMAGKKEQERRDKVKSDQEQADRRMKLTSNLSGFLGKGLYGTAEAMAASSQFEDPSHPGQMQGVKLSRDYGVPELNAPAGDPVANRGLARLLQGQAMQPSADDRAKTLAQMAPPGETSASPLEPPPFGQPRPPEPGMGDAALDAQHAYDGPEPDAGAVEETGQALDFMDEQTREQANRAQQPAHDQSLRYNLQFPGGQSVSIDPREQKRAEQAEKETTAKRYEDAAATEPDPTVRSQYMRTAAMMRAGMSNADKAGITNVVTQQDSQEFKHGEAMTHDMTAEQKHEIGMRPRAAPGGGDERGWRGEDSRDRLDIQRGGYAQGLTAKTLTRMGFTELQLGARKFNNMAEKLASNPNPALDATIAGEFVKQAQGGTGVISDNDMQVFWDNIGGIGVKTWQHVQKIINGEIEPEKRAFVMGAVKKIASITAGNLDTVGRALDTVHRGDPIIGEHGSKPNPAWREQALDTNFPGLRAKLDAEAASNAGGAPAPAPGPRPRGHTRPGKPGAPPAAAPPGPVAAPTAAPSPVLRLRDGRHVRKLPNGQYEEVSGG